MSGLHLDLAFGTVGGRTTLTRRQHTWPYAVGRVFGDGGGGARVIVQSGSGGIITGDHLRQRLSVADGARAQVLGQGAVSVHRRGQAAGAVEELELVAGPGSHLENVAEPRLLHDDGDLVQRTVVRIEPGAEQGTVLTLESVVVLGERCRYESTLEVHTGGRLAARERTCVTGSDLPAGRNAFGLLVLAGPGPVADPRSPSWEEWSRAASGVPAYGAVSRLPNDSGLAVRVVARDGGVLRDVLERAVEVLRA